MESGQLAYQIRYYTLQLLPGINTEPTGKTDAL